MRYLLMYRLLRLLPVLVPILMGGCQQTMYTARTLPRKYVATPGPRPGAIDLVDLEEVHDVIQRQILTIHS